jgi:hypothetical protein
MAQEEVSRRCTANLQVIVIGLFQRCELLEAWARRVIGSRYPVLDGDTRHVSECGWGTPKSVAQTFVERSRKPHVYSCPEGGIIQRLEEALLSDRRVQAVCQRSRAGEQEVYSEPTSDFHWTFPEL